MANIKTEQSAKRQPTRTRGRPRQFDRNDALERAMRLFWENGYEATTLADLRETLSLTQASIYAAFGGKAQLFREAVELYQRTTGGTTSRALEGQATAKQSIQAMLTDAAMVFTSGRNPAGCLVVLGTINCSRESKPVQDHLHYLRLATPRLIEKRLLRGQQDGDVAEGASIGQMAAYFTTVLHGLSIQARDGANRQTLLGVVNSAMSTWDSFLKP